MIALLLAATKPLPWDQRPWTLKLSKVLHTANGIYTFAHIGTDDFFSVWLWAWVRLIATVAFIVALIFAKTAWEHWSEKRQARAGDKGGGFREG